MTRVVFAGYSGAPLSNRAFNLRLHSREAEAGSPIKAVCAAHNISTATYHAWKRKFGGLEVSEAKRLKALADLSLILGLEYRERSSRTKSVTIQLRDEKIRAELSKAKRPFLDAVQRIIERLYDFWPLSDRQIHYALLNDPPLIHASKPSSLYRNDLASYRALSDLLTRARHEGQIDYDVIGDATRPVTCWSVKNNIAEYFREQLASLFRDYSRDLVQSQPNHIEIIGEKLTVASIIEPVAARYCLPVTIGRGYCSTRPKHDIAERYRRSGKQRLVLLIVSDFDPDGDEIAHSLARSLRDDFEIPNIDPVKVALKAEQVFDLRLPPSMISAKKTSANYRRFVDRYGGEDVYELEALPPETLQALLEEAIRNVLDVDAFNAEIKSEREDALHIEATRRIALAALGEVTDQDKSV